MFQMEKSMAFWGQPNISWQMVQLDTVQIKVLLLLAILKILLSIMLKVIEVLLAQRLGM